MIGVSTSTKSRRAKNSRSAAIIRPRAARLPRRLGGNRATSDPRGGYSVRG
jgi:hypothetical protein